MQLTLDEYIKKEKARLEQIVADTKPLFLASQSALAEFSERIFTNGKTISGGSFQYNSTLPLYINPAKTFGNTGKLKPAKGKTGKTKFASGKAHKTTYVDSYKALRGLVGREDSFVNWEATGELKSEIENRSGGAVTPKKVSDSEYKVSVQKNGNTGKLNGLITKYPGVFQFSESEKKTFYTTFNKEILLLISRNR